MAEMLIKAREPWQITETGSRKGDIIVVRPDGWKWGKDECLPHFIVAKVAGTMEEKKYLEEPLMKDAPDPEDDKKTIQVIDKYRKNAVDKTAVDTMELAVKDVKEVKAIQLTAEIKAKTVAIKEVVK